MIVVPVTPVDVPDVWFRILPYVRSIVNSMGSETDEIGIYEALATGGMVAWIVRDEDHIYSVILTEHLKTRISSYIFVYGLAGEKLKSWALLAEETITAYARNIGADKLKTFGRVGWKPYAKKCGWKPTRLVFEKDLTGEDS